MSHDGSSKAQGASAKIDKYRRILEANPSSLVFAQLAEQLLDTNQPKEALEVCERGLERHPTFVDGHYVHGRCLQRLDRRDEAIEAYKAVLSRNPNHLLARQGLSALGGGESLEGGVLSPQILAGQEMKREGIDPATAPKKVSPEFENIRERLFYDDEKEPYKPFPWVKVIVSLLLLTAIGAGVYLYFSMRQAEIDTAVQVFEERSLKVAHDLQYQEIDTLVKDITEFVGQHPGEAKRLAPVTAMVSALAYGEFDRSGSLWRDRMEAGAGSPEYNVSERTGKFRNLASALRAFYENQLGGTGYYLQQIPRSSQTNTLTETLRGALLYKEEDREEGMVVLETVVSEDSTAVLPHVMLARMYMQSGKAEKATDMLKQLMGRVGTHRLIDLYLLLAQSHQQQLLPPEHQEAEALLADKSLPPVYDAMSRLILASEAIITKEAKVARVLLDRFPVNAYDCPRYRYLSGVAWRMTGEYAKAETDIKKAMERDGRKVAYLSELIRVYHARRNYRNLLGAFDMMKEDGFEDPRLWIMVGDAHIAMGNYELAAQLYRRALFAQPKDEYTMMHYARALINGGNYPQADRFIRRLMLEYKHKPFPHYLNGMLWLAQKEVEKAEAGFKEALNRQANYTDALYAMANLKRETGDVEAFVSYAGKLYKAHPDYSPGMLLWIDWLIFEGRYQEARDILWKAKEAPSSCEMQLIRLRGSIIDLLEGQSLKVMTRLQKEDYPEDCCGLSHAVLAWAYALSGFSDKVTAATRKALSKGGGCARVHTYVGNAVLDINDMGWAMNEYRTALEIDPVQPDVMFRLGSLYIQRKMLGEAKVLIEKAKAWYDHAPLQKHRQAEIQYWLGVISINQNHHSAAKRFFASAMKLDPDFALPYVAISRYFHKGGNNKLALSTLKKALKIQKDNPQALYELGDVYRIMGKKKAAIEHFKKYLAIAPDGPESDQCREFLEQLRGDTP